MKAFLLAAGFGERLRPLTLEKPKPLIPVLGIPSICFALTFLKEAGIRKVVCNLHYRADDIVTFFRDNGYFGFDVTFSMEKEIMGTGGGLKLCENFLEDGPFLMINSDIVTDISTSELIDEFNGTDDAGRIVICPPGRAGEATVSVNGDRVVDFRNTLNSSISATYDYTGLAVLSPEIFPLLDSGFSSVVYGGFTTLASRGRLGYHVHAGMWLDIGSVETLNAAERMLREKGSDLLKRVENATGFRVSR